jgi:TolB protein
MRMKLAWAAGSAAALTVIHVIAATAAPGSVQWQGEPAVFAPGVVSSEFREVRLTVSPDGSMMLWGSSNRPGGPGEYDIWIVRRNGNAWSAPESVSFNTKAKEFDPAFSPDGRFVYFFSNRPGGLGGDDIYRVAVSGSSFGAVEHLGAEINSAGNDWAPTPSPDGRALLFASDGRGGKGRQDLFVSNLVDGRWSKAEPLPGAVNTPGDEFDATFLSDNKTLVYSYSANIDSEAVSLHIATRGTSGYERGTLLPFSSPFQYAYGPGIDLRNPAVLYFAGVPKGSKAGADIYEVRYRLAR